MRVFWISSLVFLAEEQKEKENGSFPVQKNQEGYNQFPVTLKRDDGEF